MPGGAGAGGSRVGQPDLGKPQRRALSDRQSGGGCDGRREPGRRAGKSPHFSALVPALPLSWSSSAASLANLLKHGPLCPPPLRLHSVILSWDLIFCMSNCRPDSAAVASVPKAMTKATFQPQEHVSAHIHIHKNSEHFHWGSC